MERKAKILIFKQMFDIMNPVIHMRSILHCDLNGFFASVECLKRPELKNVPMAVCGDPKTRHGVILAKNELAKKYGIYTPETVYSAKKKCPHLVLVSPHHEEYRKYSKLVNQIYLKYTDRVEPFSIDESFLDITESLDLFGSAYHIAYQIKEEVKQTLGLTISVGVSFNKIFAKLGSDMKKPDAITVIDEKHYQEILYPLPIETMLFVGKATASTLRKMRIETIGDLARCDVHRLVKKIGKLGLELYEYANGRDDREVKLFTDKREAKSISRGITFQSDIQDSNILIEKMGVLVEDIAKNLRKQDYKASSVALILKFSDFSVISRQRKIFKTDSYHEILKVAIDLFHENYYAEKPVRKLTLGVGNLENKKDNIQLDLFELQSFKQKDEKQKKMAQAMHVMDQMNEKYGNHKITFGNIIKK